MAGLEQVEVHSKSYLVRWVNVSAGHTISWSIQPHKKSLNFGIFKHPGTNNDSTTGLPSSAVFDGPATPALEVPTHQTRPRGHSNALTRNDKSWVVEKLQGLGYKKVAWAGKCEADKVSMGKFDVPEGEGGMYGLVFDNTFSKTVSKTATFVLITHPTNAPPKSGHHMHYAQNYNAGASSSSLPTKSSPRLLAVSDSTDSLPQDPSVGNKINVEFRPKSSHTGDSNSFNDGTFYTGILQKKRRKKNQGYARRFFSLDFTSSTLSYYRNNHSSALRGAIPLSLAAIGANEKTREISVDSGAEVWHLRANNKKDFEAWRNALERAAATAGGISSPTIAIQNPTWPNGPQMVNQAEEREWARVESLVGRVAGTRDAVRRLAQDTDPKYSSTLAGLGIAKASESLSPSPTDGEPTDYFPSTSSGEKMPFWKRKASSSGASTSPSGVFRRSVSAQLAVASPSTLPPGSPIPNGSLAVPKRQSRATSHPPPEEGVHDNCMSLLRDLDSVIQEFSTLLNESRARRTPAPLSTPARNSIDSQSSEEFFDAHDGETVRSGLLTIRRDSGEKSEREDASDGGSESSSEEEGPGSFERRATFREGQPSIFPGKPKSLTPLPIDPVRRRNTVPPPKTNPPSLISFLRKNVGKDLSTIAMPVSANEPTSLLQRIAEQMEYTELLDAASAAPSETGERLAHVAAFAISTFSNARVKDRAIRKPFNPMLGETFELVREDKGYRFIAEKVSHRPVRMACQAESANWTFLQSPMPVQKFWGKSAELNTEGCARVFFHNSNEHYSWSQATSFLRNVIAGEKYVEPVGTMTIENENSGAKAVCTFKAGGMFAGRSEEVTVQVFDASGELLPLGLTGKWTTELNLTNNGQGIGRTLWSVGSLVENPTQHYGFTTFAASLNQVTEIEKGKLPVTDSRLRPDQRAAEEGDLDRAEALKARLEERQRARRRVMEEHGEVWTPRWFAPIEGAEVGEEVWRLKSGKEGYWEERARREFTDVTDVFQA
ncbi:oxysterol binding protein 1 [Mytilinidion resinicola]|uniref:Oxysterol binding protein 1 n=1 Tax=Mytilinidion resinicola TaxID=574789 RepID=A0A6A6YSZ0_9PEZI|nr:oxysterol binding protein 1 [Mytilinidion resinicola]KAF2812066.1 oxysterol binding protein 1 [Mytilinidion resinicola]